jgi:hypothetical protein
MKDRIATTVKVEPSIYDEMKVLGVRHKISLQSFVDRCIFLYLKETEVSGSFRDIVNNTFPPKQMTTGSL